MTSDPFATRRHLAACIARPDVSTEPRVVEAQGNPDVVRQRTLAQTERLFSEAEFDRLPFAAQRAEIRRRLAMVPDVTVDR